MMRLPKVHTSRAMRALAFAGLLGVPAPAVLRAQAPDAPERAWRPLASRAELEAVVGNPSHGNDAGDAAARTEAARRLRDGDFRVGDLVLLFVQGETALSDTFAVTTARELLLPSPTTGALALGGLLRSELEPRVREHIGRFMRDPVVRARPLLRIAITGQVGRAGYYAVPIDAPIADALMAADGVAPTGDLAKLTVTRNGRTVIAPRRMRELLARGTTLDQARLSDGDELEVGRGHEGWSDRLQFLWIVISLTGGIYGITRSF